MKLLTASTNPTPSPAAVFSLSSFLMRSRSVSFREVWYASSHSGGNAPHIARGERNNGIQFHFSFGQTRLERVPRWAFFEAFTGRRPDRYRSRRTILRDFRDRGRQFGVAQFDSLRRKCMSGNPRRTVIYDGVSRAKRRDTRYTNRSGLRQCLRRHRLRRFQDDLADKHP